MLSAIAKSIRKIYRVKLKLNNLFFEERRSDFFKKIEKYVYGYLNVYITRPSLIVDTNDYAFNFIDLYKVKSSKIHDYKIEERQKVFKRVQSYVINVNSCLYFVYNHRINTIEGQIKQPVIFTVWMLGEEVRLGCFVNNHLDENFKKEILEKLNTIFNVFKTDCFLGRENEIERNDYYLKEYILTNKGSDKLLKSDEKQRFIITSFSLFVAQMVLFFEDTKDRIIEENKDYYQLKDEGQA